TGNTISKEMITDRFSGETQISTRMIKDATGTDLIVCTKGSRSSSIRRDAAAAAASSTPLIIPSRNPDRILRKEQARDCQKGAVCTSSKSLLITATGDTSSISCPIHTLAACQTICQTAAAQSLMFDFFLLLDIV